MDARSLKQQLAQRARETGFSAFGVARSAPVDESWQRSYRQWLDSGCGAEMHYLSNHPQLRSHPAELLPGAQSVISLALNYFHTEQQQADAIIAMYAHGDDYHEVARLMMRPLIEILESHGFEARACVDTAPVRERYWALCSGIAFAGRNGLAIVPDVGSFCFLSEIITTAPLPPDAPLTKTCQGCGKCVEACPGHAIMADGKIDARRCHSYLSIEHRGELPPGTTLRTLYGCDICQRVCPHNQQATETTVSALKLRDTLRDLTLRQVAALTPQTFATLFRHSAVKRAKLTGLQRNLKYLPFPLVPLAPLD
ncbi:MAG: tRNA epoxyqueuosine(34) reductase QueG [Muribaculaceae bacterium]|nr:tRNA epoxyqueuosine(34) reductase QueG [Muribaculaceae bacterium]